MITIILKLILIQIYLFGPLLLIAYINNKFKKQTPRRENGEFKRKIKIGGMYKEEGLYFYI